MPSVRPRVSSLVLLASTLFPGFLPARQNPSAINEFFEGRKVMLRLDMPGTHQGVDIYPQRPQPLDMKAYSNRLKQFGVALRDGDSVIITKVKVKDDNIEFHLAGGGYGTSGDDTDVSVHFTPTEKSGHEKDLESLVKSESNPDKRRSLQRELEEVRSYRERRDRQEREMAEQAAEAKKQMVMSRRLQGGSRFNLRMDVRSMGAAVTPQMVMASLSNYATFPPESFAGSTSARAPDAVRTDAPAPQPAGDPSFSLRKGLTREQVEAVYGLPSDTHENAQNGLTIVSCTYKTKDNTVKADFVNGVLIQYALSSR